MRVEKGSTILVCTQTWQVQPTAHPCSEAYVVYLHGGQAAPFQLAYLGNANQSGFPGERKDMLAHDGRGPHVGSYPLGCSTGAVEAVVAALPSRPQGARAGGRADRCLRGRRGPVFAWAKARSGRRPPAGSSPSPSRPRGVLGRSGSLGVLGVGSAGVRGVTGTVHRFVSWSAPGKPSCGQNRSLSLLPWLQGVTSAANANHVGTFKSGDLRWPRI